MVSEIETLAAAGCPVACHRALVAQLRTSTRTNACDIGDGEELMSGRWTLDL